MHHSNSLAPPSLIPSLTAENLRVETIPEQQKNEDASSSKSDDSSIDSSDEQKSVTIFDRSDVDIGRVDG
jgi:hypothetical protein